MLAVVAGIGSKCHNLFHPLLVLNTSSSSSSSSPRLHYHRHPGLGYLPPHPFKPNSNRNPISNIDVQLLKASQSYLSTTAGSTTGILFISTEKVDFCSERKITLASSAEGVVTTPYKKGDNIESFMDRLAVAARLMIVSDLDHTMVDHHDSENLSLLRFNALWEANFRDNSLLVFSTGRSPILYMELRKEKPMLTPDITIMSVGTEITYGNSMVPDDGWVEYLNQKWDRKIVTEETSKFPELTLQSETEQRPHKVSFYVQKDKAQDVMKALDVQLKGRGLDVKIIYSGGMDLDILPQGAGKGQALAYLLKKFKAESKLPDNTLVCGDSGNDAELFSIPEVYGVMVSNAQEELLQWHAANAKDNPKIIHATERCAAGIIQAIGHFNLGPSRSLRDVSDLHDCQREKFDPAYEVVKFNLFVEKWRRAEVENSELYLANMKSVCSPSGVFVHPSGMEKSLCGCLNALRDCHGDQQGKSYRVWVDQVLPTQVGSDSWLVKYKKWELSGDKRKCCLTTVLLSSKGVSVAEGLTWVHVHQTWLAGAGSPDDSTWLF